MKHSGVYLLWGKLKLSVFEFDSGIHPLYIFNRHDH